MGLFANEMHHLLAEPRPAILWIAEESDLGRQWFLDQAANYLQQESKTCFRLNRELLKDIPIELKDHILKKQLAALDANAVIFITEQELNDPLILRLMTEKKCKVICFKAAGQKEKQSILANMPAGELIQTGLNVARQLMPDVIPPSSPAPTTAAPSPLSAFPQFNYQPADNENTLNQLLGYYVRSQKGSQDLSRSVQLLYPLHAGAKRKSDHICGLLVRDYPHIENLKAEEICNYFYTRYGAELKMTLDDIKYEADPSLTSNGYQYKRAFKGFGRRIFGFLTLPFRWMGPAATAGLSSIASTFAIGRMLTWARYLLFKF
jgi:hypothetical protein